MLDAKSERAVAAIAEDARALFGARLVSAALYGSATTADFVAGASDLNVVLVLDRLDFDSVEALRKHATSWRRRGAATPLLIDRNFLEAARDVFPMELRDIASHHRLLHGDDVFTGIHVEARHLRAQCEREVRGKLLRLHELYLEVADDRRALRHLMLDSLKTFLIIMRHLNRLSAAPEGDSYEEALTAFCTRSRRPFPTTAHLLQIKLGRARWSDGAEDTFRSYWNEMRQLAAAVDALPVEPPSGEDA